MHDDRCAYNEVDCGCARRSAVRVREQNDAATAYRLIMLGAEIDWPKGSIPRAVVARPVRIAIGEHFAIAGGAWNTQVEVEYTIEVELTVKCSVSPGEPERGPSYASGGEPGDPGEVEILSAKMDGLDLKALLSADDIQQIEDMAREAANEASEEDPDDARDAARDREDDDRDYRRERLDD